METAERTYEIPVWLRLADDGSVDEALIGRMREHLGRLGAQILRETKPAKRRLAYPIANAREGAFVVFDVKMNPAQVANVIPAFKHDKAIIRVGVAEKTESMHERLGQPSRPRSAASAERHEEIAEERKEIKMEELEKKLEEILHGDADA